ncbi:hypothetical protein EI427_17355 [Flammeovirga pectinis]|uniref:RHS repeat-associated core domain-containing protein n=1 Tax=Flammeovirga pectinis TaxID=2494373 RepID=A0A3Q9FSY7_9BACT|nr:RHS repeat-associated core domain-containing protein [Flammeovirga pectinis]AZQ63928.1 hypothetical protein EI427_17355 [Flammeovirga pectinis]
MKIGYQTDRKYRYGYQGEFAEDETNETGFNSFEARMYDPVIGRWMSVDPARQYASGYVGMGNNPILKVDPDGRSDNPIYDLEGNFLGTDSRGLQGEAIIMHKDLFTQGMSHSQANDIGMRLGDAPDDFEYYDKVFSHFETLFERPDYDGYINLKEALDWWKKGNGETLYIDVSKLEFYTSELSPNDFSNIDTRSVNFFSPVDIHKDIKSILYKPALVSSSISSVFGTLKVHYNKHENTYSLVLDRNGFIDTFDYGTAFKYLATTLSPNTQYGSVTFHFKSYGKFKIN